MKRSVVFLSLVALAVGLGAVGCSDDTIEHVTSSDNKYWFSDTQEPDYFPLQEGFEITYEVTTTGATEYQTFWIGTPVSVSGVTYYPWITNQSSRVDTAWFRETSTGLYHYSSLTADPERILAYPITTGTSWSRYDTDSIEGGGTGLNDYLNDDGLVSNEQNGNGPIVGDFPVTGSATLFVESIEMLELENGKTYSGALKVRNDGTGGYNCYWFVPGIGLARYAIGAVDADAKSGSVVGELAEFVK